jgi:energy-coupling factor transport system permease protein
MLEPLAVRGDAPLARVHPLAKLGAAAALMLALFLSRDPVTPALVLAVLLATVPALGLAFGALAPRALPLAIAAVGIAVLNGLAGGAIAGLAAALRLSAIALAGLLAFVAVDPTELADALVQQARVPPRLAIGTLAAYRLFPLFAREWERIALARRARGIETDRSPLARLAGFPERALALLVGAVRRATRLALAMDARGFDARPCRTVARPMRFGPRDAAVLAGGAAVAVGAVAISAALGTWRFLLG